MYRDLTLISFFVNSITVLPALAFENLNSLETLNIQNNKLTRIPEEVMEPIMDTLRVVDIMGKCSNISNGIRLSKMQSTCIVFSDVRHQMMPPSISLSS